MPSRSTNWVYSLCSNSSSILKPVFPLFLLNIVIACFLSPFLFVFNFCLIPWWGSRLLRVSWGGCLGRAHWDRKGKLRGKRLQRLEGAMGLQSWKGGNMWQPTGPRTAQRDPQGLVASAGNGLCPHRTIVGAGSAWSSTTTWQDPVFPFRSDVVLFFPTCFLYDCFIWLFSWTTEILQRWPFLHDETNIPAVALTPVHNCCSWSRNKGKKKKKQAEKAEGRGKMF